MQIKTQDIEPTLIDRQTQQAVDIAQCQRHLEATRIAQPIDKSKMCQCCKMPYEKEQLPFCYQTGKLSYLGPGLCLHLYFIKLAFLIAIISTLIVSAASTFYNLTSDACLSQPWLKCSSTWFIRLSIANKLDRPQLIRLQSILINVNIVLIFILIEVGRKKMRDFEVEESTTASPADYAVMLKMPQKQYYRERDIREITAEWFDSLKTRGKTNDSPYLFKCKEEFPIEKVIISYDLSTFREMEKELNQLTEEVRRLVPSPGGTNLAKKLKRIQALRQLISSKSFVKNSKCIVIFKFQEQKHFILSQYNFSYVASLFCCLEDPIYYNDKRIQVTQVPMPGQICWQNHHIKYPQKLRMRIIIFLSSIIFLLIGQAIIMGILYLWFRYRKDNPDIQSYVSPVISLIINLVNTVLYKSMTYMTRYEYRPTKLEQYTSMAKKITVCVFLNTGVMLLLAYFIIDLTSVWIYNGFIDTMSYSFLFSIVLPQLYKYADWDALKKRYGRWRVGRGLKISQQEANSYFEREEIKLHELYAWTVNQIWWCSLFSPLMPIAYPCVALSLLLHYLVEKVNLKVWYGQPKPFGSKMNQEMLNFLQFCLLFMAFGNLLTDVLINRLAGRWPESGTIFFDLVGIFFGLLVIVLPWSWLNKIASTLLCCQKQKMFLNVEYCQKNFITTYEKQNPIYKYDAVHKYKAIEDNIDVEMEKVAHVLHQTLKKTHMAMHHPFHLNISAEQSDESQNSVVMYASNNYPEKVSFRATRKPSSAFVPNLGIGSSRRQRTSIEKPQTDHVVEFKDIVKGMDEVTKGMVLSRLRSSLKQIKK